MNIPWVLSFQTRIQKMGPTRYHFGVVTRTDNQVAIADSVPMNDCDALQDAQGHNEGRLHLQHPRRRRSRPSYSIQCEIREFSFRKSRICFLGRTLQDGV